MLTVRIRKNYNTLIDFVVFINKNKVKKEKMILDTILKEGLQILSENNSNTIKIFKNFENREPRGFNIKDDTIRAIEEQYQKYKLIYKEKYNITVNLGMIYELLIYLWCSKNFTTEDFNYINMNYIKGQWGFQKI